MNIIEPPVRVGVVIEARDVRALDKIAAQSFATRSAFVRALVLKHIRDVADRNARSTEATAA